MGPQAVWVGRWGLHTAGRAAGAGGIPPLPAPTPARASATYFEGRGGRAEHYTWDP